jgi:dTDP-4-amino-4,6-dideoxygalactose transaminase
MPVHIYGEPVDMDAIKKIANDHDLFTIYDAAHTFGVKYKNKGIGTFGDISIFSTHATKVFHTIEGGLMTFNNKELYRMSKLITNFGMDENYNCIYPGSNGKMNEFQAAMGLSIIDDIDIIINERKICVDLYKQYLDNDIIFTKFENSDVKYNYIYFIIKHKNRNLIHDTLLRKGITTRKYFHPLTSNYTLFKNKNGVFKNAEILSDQVLALPLYPGLTEKDIKRIAKEINKIIK